MAWLRITLAVTVYLIMALLASWIISRRGGDLREMEGRTSPAVLVIGVVGNLVVLGAVLFLVVAMDHRPLSALGLGLDGRDAVFVAVAVALTLASGLGFLALVARLGDLEMRPRSLPAGTIGRLLATAVVLLIVAMQEEYLFRGYVALDLMDYGPTAVLGVSTLLFTAIHFLTNRVTSGQVLGWLLGGLILGWVYLASGSIWVPVAIHFAMDMTNILVFGMAGELALTRLSRPLGDRSRAVYRAGYVVLISVVLVGVYGLQLAPLWSG